MSFANTSSGLCLPTGRSAIFNACRGLETVLRHTFMSWWDSGYNLWGSYSVPPFRDGAWGLVKVGPLSQRRSTSPEPARQELIRLLPTSAPHHRPLLMPSAPWGVRPWAPALLLFSSLHQWYDFTNAWRSLKFLKNYVQFLNVP